MSEYRFYTELMPRLAIPGPQLFSSGHLPDDTLYLVMADLSLDHVIPPEGHVWTDQELQSVMRTYGLLHGRSLRLLHDEAPPGALLDLYLDTLAGETGYRPETTAFHKQRAAAALLGWAIFMPRMVNAMNRCNAEGRQFSPWMATTFRNCMLDWQEALSQ